MATQDKAMLMNQVSDTLRSRMFANLLDEAVEEINETLDWYEITHIAGEADSSCDLMKTYIDAKRAEGRSEKTLFLYQYRIIKFLQFAKVSIRDVTTHHIRDYLAAEQGRGIADATVEGIRSTLNAFFGWLEHERLITRNPAANITPIKCTKKIKEAFSETDLDKLKRACADARDLAIVNFFLSTGCRVSEVTGLNRDDVNISTGECIVLGKGDKERRVYLNRTAVLALTEYLATRRDRNPALFVSKIGAKRLEPNGMRVFFQAA